MSPALAPPALPAKTRALNLARAWLLHTLGEDWLARHCGRQPSSSWRAKMLPNSYQFPKPTWRTAERRGLKYKLDISELVDWHVYFEIDQAERDTLFKLAKPGDIVVDIGANIGETALNLARVVGVRGRVHAFEPDGGTFEKAAANLGLNQCGQLLLHNQALGSSEGEVTIEPRVPGNSGMNRVALAGAGIHGLKARMTTLDEFARRSGLPRIDLIKADVEGFEEEVLKGATRVLEAFSPILFLEVDDANLKDAGSSPSQLFGRLDRLGYSSVRADSGEPIDPARPPDGHFDIVARRR